MRRCDTSSDVEDDSDYQESSCGCSSDGDSSSLSDVEAEGAMKRSRRFCRSFSFGEDQQAEDEGREEPASISTTKAMESGSKAESMQIERRGALCEVNRTRSGLFRPQELWLAVTRCLSLRWLSISGQTKQKLAHQKDTDQSEEAQTSFSSDSLNEGSCSSWSSNGREAAPSKHEEKDVRSKVTKAGPPSHRQRVSRSSPQLPRSRQATDSLLASMILDKEMFLRIELEDSGTEGDASRYRAEWTLSERTKELAEGVWVSRTMRAVD